MRRTIKSMSMPSRLGMPNETWRDLDRRPGRLTSDEVKALNRALCVFLGPSETAAAHG
jgi:hypothetical protein